MITLNQVRIERTDFQLHIDHLQLNTGLTMLVGRNGAGKSTLLQLLATAVFPDTGEVRYGSKTTATDLPLIRSRIGFLPTGLELYEEMTPKKLIVYFSELKGIVSSNQMVDQHLEAFNLSMVKNTKIRSLSQGTRQMLAITQALLGDPAILLLDEPLNYLDNQERKRIISILSLFARNKMVVVATHELNEWDSCADQILWMDDGRVRFYKEVVFWMKGLSMRVWLGRMSIDSLNTIDPSQLIQFKDDGDQAEVRLIAADRPKGQFVQVDPTIEDAYFIRRLMLEVDRDRK